MDKLIRRNPAESVRLCQDLINLQNTLRWLLTQPEVNDEPTLKSTTDTLIKALELYTGIFSMVLEREALKNE